MKRVFFVSLFLSLSLSEEQTKGAKRTKILSRAFKKKTLLFAERAVVSLPRLFFFIFHFSHKNGNTEFRPTFFRSIAPIKVGRNRLIFFLEPPLHKKYEKKKPNAFWSIQIALTRGRGFYISHRESHFFFSVAFSRLLSEARVDRSENTHAHSYTHTQSIIVSWRERCTCSPR